MCARFASMVISGFTSPSLVPYSSSLSFSPLFLLCFSRFFRLLARWRPGICDRRECVSIAGRFGLLKFSPSLVPCSTCLPFILYCCKWMQAICISSLISTALAPCSFGLADFIYVFLGFFFVPLFYWDLHPPAGVWVCFGVSRDLGLSRVQLMCMDFRWQGAL